MQVSFFFKCRSTHTLQIIFIMRAKYNFSFIKIKESKTISVSFKWVNKALFSITLKSDVTASKKVLISQSDLIF